MPQGLVYFLFLCSGVSGLVYQVVWVREFGTVFGNTIYSSSIVVAIFMLGLGAGSYIAGQWADRRYAVAPDSLLRAYAYAELLIAAFALTVTLTLPMLGPLVARASSYVAGAGGWFVLSPRSYAARALIAVVLLAPVTLLMGANLTLLVRHLIRHDVESAGGWKVALLYGVNTIGAAVGAFGTDYLLVPLSGLRATQLIAVGLNVIAGAGAFVLATRTRAPRQMRDIRSVPAKQPPTPSAAILWTGAALTLSGCAAMGLEIVWLRHFTLLLGGFRSVFSLVVTVLLVGTGAGSLLGGALNRLIARPAEMLMAVLALFVGAVLAGFAFARFPLVGPESELWHNLRPMLFEAGLPSILIGCSFPLANAVVQHAEAAVGQRAGALYLGNTIGAVAGSLLAGFVLLPRVGTQTTVTLLTLAAGLAIAPLALTIPVRRAMPVLAACIAVLAGAFGGWLQLAPDHLMREALGPRPAGEQRLAFSEGVNEVIEVADAPGRGRGLLTNGHPMSSTAWLDQRYMRALAHVPLLSIGDGARVLVIGFGVGNTTHAAALHASVARVDVVDLSRRVLEHAGYFRDVNGGVLGDRRVSVFVNDGRQHLQMATPAQYDLITLEPPPIAHAGVASLYSREFYELARTRLKPGGYLSQWLPAYQVPAPTSLAMVRAFVDVFPQSVLLSGMGPELLLFGTTAAKLELDPEHLAQTLDREPLVRADLQRFDLGTPTEIAGMFVGSAGTLARATADVRGVTDDRPLQEYSVRSAAAATSGVPASLYDAPSLAAWCPRCLDGNRPAAVVPKLDVYLALLDVAYRSGAEKTRSTATPRTILGSRYLGAVVPDTDAADNIIRHTEAIAQYDMGRSLLDRRQFKEAVKYFRAALPAMFESPSLHNDLGVALASTGDLRDAIEEFKQAVSLEPGFDEARRNLESALRVEHGG